MIFEWSNYYSYQPFWKVFAVWEGGMAIHGAIVLGPLALVLYCWIKRIALAAMLDISAFCIILGQAIGRWGNFTNGEAAGPVTGVWSGIVFRKELQWIDMPKDNLFILPCFMNHY